MSVFTKLAESIWQREGEPVGLSYDQVDELVARHLASQTESVRAEVAAELCLLASGSGML